MKANAPEKIYIDADENWHRTHTAFIEKAKGNDIEYTRTDAFIKRAYEWIETHTCVFKSVEEVDMFKDLFKKAMEEGL